MSLYEKIYNVMNESEAIEKNMEVGSGKNAYKAVSEATILNMIKPLFKKYKLIIFPVSGEIKDHCSTWNKTDYDGKISENLRAMTELKVVYRILDVESKEFQDVVGFGNGSDPQDKGAGKAFTYSLKNVLSKTFMLFSGEDTDNTHSDDIGMTKSNKQPSNQIGNNEPVNVKTTTAPPSDLEKRAAAIYFLMTGNKEGQHNMGKEEYKDWLQKMYDANKISAMYGKKWTKNDIEYIESEIKGEKLPF